jgi:hypothetical protein
MVAKRSIHYSTPRDRECDNALRFLSYNFWFHLLWMVMKARVENRRSRLCWSSGGVLTIYIGHILPLNCSQMFYQYPVSADPEVFIA